MFTGYTLSRPFSSILWLRGSPHPVHQGDLRAGPRSRPACRPASSPRRCWTRWTTLLLSLCRFGSGSWCGRHGIVPVAAPERLGHVLCEWELHKQPLPAAKSPFLPDCSPTVSFNTCSWPIAEMFLPRNIVVVLLASLATTVTAHPGPGWSSPHSPNSFCSEVNALVTFARAQSAATAFCSSYLSIPVATHTVTTAPWAKTTTTTVTSHVVPAAS